MKFLRKQIVDYDIYIYIFWTTWRCFDSTIFGFKVLYSIWYFSYAVYVLLYSDLFFFIAIFLNFLVI